MSTGAGDPVTPNPWQALRQLTAARIALGRAGVSLPTQPHLAFQLAHAQARDAVHLALDVPALQAAVQALGLETLALHSAAPDRHTYLQRPDLGRRLSAPSRELLLQRLSASEQAALAGPCPSTGPQGSPPHRPFDIAFVVADGLSALAIASHAVPFLSAMLPLLQAQAWSVAPVAVVAQGRVAVADEIGQLLGARLVVILIGERPGLSSPDSMGLYFTWMPQPGLTDASRNCISNVRPAGLPVADAAHKLMHLLTQARALGLTGVGLKDESEAPPALTQNPGAGPVFRLLG
jgi:ethanolamine ammonia-lyase small subunit